MFGICKALFETRHTFAHDDLWRTFLKTHILNMNWNSILKVLVIVSLFSVSFAIPNFEEFKDSLAHFDVIIYVWSNNGSDLSGSCNFAHSPITYSV